VLADMLELVPERAENEHAKIGLAVSDLEFEYLLTWFRNRISRFTHASVESWHFAETFPKQPGLPLLLG